MFESMFDKRKKKESIGLSQLEVTTIIGTDFVFNGQLNGVSVVRIDGKVIGDVFVEKGVIIGENGVIEGELNTNLAVIFGTINGNVKAFHVEVKSSGVINGDIKSEILEVDMGARFNGKLEMKQLLKKEEEEEFNPNSN